MTIFSTAARLCLVAALLGAVLLTGSARSGFAAEVSPAAAVVPVSQTGDAGKSAPVTQADPATLRGAVGFGWG